MKKIGYNTLWAAIIVEIIMLLIIIWTLISLWINDTVAGVIIVNLFTTIIIILFEALAVYLSKESKIWLYVLLVLGVITFIMSVTSGSLPIAAVLFIVGSVLMLKDFRSAMNKPR